MKRRIILAVIFAGFLGATMWFSNGFGVYAICIWRHPFWTPIACTLGSIPYWMVFAPLLYWARPNSVLDTTAAGWLCGIFMSLLWGILATYVLDGVRRLRRRTIVVGVIVVVAVLAFVSMLSVRRSNRCMGASTDLQVGRSQIYLDKLDSLIKAYNERYHRYPLTIQELNAGFPENEYPFSLNDHIENGKLFRQKYVYRVNAEQTQYTLFSLGIDGQEGTADDLYPSRKDVKK